MKKSWKSLILAGMLSLSLSVPTFAGSWQLDSTGYWYQKDDGTYYANGWQWIDGNGDGVAESYYFNEKGYILVNTTTPDGFTVDGNGAWTVNGVVQTKTVAVSSGSTSSGSAPSAPAQTQKQETSTSGTSGTSGSTRGTSRISDASETSSTVPQTDMVWLSATGSKYHRTNHCGNMNPNKARSVSRDEAIQKGYDACKKCY